MEGISGLASERSTMNCLILPLFRLGDLLGQNKLASVLAWVCRRCMVRYDELGDIILQADGSAKPSAPPPRLTREHRLAYDFMEKHGDGSYVTALGAHTYARPALLELVSGPQAIGIACADGGALEGLVDDAMHLKNLGMEKMLHQFASLFIVDSWANPQEGVLAVRRFELRIAAVPSYNDGLIFRRSFPDGYLLNSHLTASDREDLTTLFVCGIGSDNLVIHNEEQRLEFLRMVDDFVYVMSVIAALNINTVTWVAMQKSNYR